MVDKECIVDKLVSEASKKSKYKKKMCIHNKRLSRCLICPGGGSELCEHNVSKYTCKRCHGNGVCEHNKSRTFCVLCKGGATCIHGKSKYICKLCKGNGICEHNILKLGCKICKGSSICQHNKRKQSCKICHGSNICIHNKHKRCCRLCNGNGICKHNKQKSMCAICGGSGLCKNEWCITKKRYNGYCARCYIFQFPDTKLSKNYKTKENTTVSKIEEYFPNLTWVKDRKIEGGCSMRRPDLLVDMGSHIIIIEIDENRHNTESYSCENKRICQIWNDVGERNIIFIRFNPDSYTNSEGVKIKSCFKENRKIGALTLNPKEEQQWNERIDKLLETIEYWTNNVPDKLINIVFLFYDEIIEENDEEKE